MRSNLLGTAAAIFITLIGLQGTAFAASTDVETATVRQVTVTIENTFEGDGDLSNMPEASHDDSENE